MGKKVGKAVIANQEQLLSNQAGELGKDGNGIPNAIAQMLQEKTKDLATHCKSNPPQQESADSMFYRSYEDFSHPKLPDYYWEVYNELPQTESQFLIHVGGEGDPRCFCVKCSGALGPYIIKQKDNSIQLAAPVMRSLVNKCLDRRSIVFFSVTLEWKKENTHRPLC